jgi:hypothetical protein
MGKVGKAAIQFRGSSKMNQFDTMPREREANKYEGIKTRALEKLRATIPPEELACLPKRSLRNRVALATIDAAFHTDARKTELAKVQRDILKAMIGDRADAAND